MTIQSKINPLKCFPFWAGFDGDCVLIYYPQSLVRDQLNSYPDILAQGCSLIVWVLVQKS